MGYDARELELPLVKQRGTTTEAELTEPSRVRLHSSVRIAGDAGDCRDERSRRLVASCLSFFHRLSSRQAHPETTYSSYRGVYE